MTNSKSSFLRIFVINVNGKKKIGQSIFYVKGGRHKHKTQADDKSTDYSSASRRDPHI